MSEQHTPEVERFMAAMKMAKPTFPLKMWVQSDGTICWASAGTSHMWAGWMLVIATKGGAS